MASTTEPEPTTPGDGAYMTAEGLSPAMPKGHPPAFWFIFWGEFAERCSYYGMRAILPLYLLTAMGFEEGRMTSVYSLFKSACYFLPLLGGYLADRFFGKYWTIVGFSVPYVLGHFILGMETTTTLFIALALLAGGSGVIKPNISTLMGKTYDQKRPGQKALLTSAFLWFYFSINVGATLSLWGLPRMRDYLIDQYLARYELREESITLNDGSQSTAWFTTNAGVREQISKEEVEALKLAANRYAYPLAFQVPAWLMVAALGAFALGKPFYAVEQVGRDQSVSEEERAQRWQVLMRLFGVFGLIVFFWVAYEQNDNLWTLFAKDHIAQKIVDPATGKEKETCVLRLGNWQDEYPPDGFQWINSALIIVLVPLFGIMWRNVDPQGKRFPPTRKILMGFIWTAAAAGVMALASLQAQDGTKVSAW